VALEQKVQERTWELQSERQRLNDILYGTNAGTWEWNVRTGETIFNERWAKIIGYGLHELEPVSIQTWIDFCHPEDLKASNELLEKHFKGEIDYYECESRMKHKDGHWIWVIGRGKVYSWTEDNEPLMMSGTHQDITRSKLAENALGESQRRFQTIADFTYDWEYWIAPDGNFIYNSPSCRRITGYGPDDFINDPGLMEKIIHPEDLPLVKKQEKKVIKSDESHSADFRIITKSGDERWIGHNCRPVYDDDMRFIGKRGSNRDITEQISLQRESIKAQQMAAVGTLAGGVAHQFNNALSVVSGNLELLEEDFPGNKTVGIYANEMKASTERMKRLTAQLLAYARGGKYQATTVSLGDFITEAISIINYEIDPGITIDTDLPDSGLRVKVDQTQMQMVLSSVLSNASEAIDGKGLIRIMLRSASIDNTAKELPYLKPGNYACLTVSDDGRGMDEETQNRIFEPFFTTIFEGRGLGMAAAYGIVKNHNGAISVLSELGNGTTISIYLPLVEISSENKQKPKPHAGLSKGEGTILVIDDDESVMTVCRTMLERLGYFVLEAKSGEEAVSIVRSYDGIIDLALLDVVMPDMNGDVVYSMLKNSRRDLKVIVISGFSLDGPARNIMNAGAEGFIQKPFTKTDLSKKIRGILEPE
jgi:two-component system, cell cycle sensor histidine kinase and response regulator CckA